MEPSKSPRFLTLIMLFGAVVFGMVLAGSLNLTVPSQGLTSSETANAAENSVGAPGPSSAAGLPSFADLAEAVLPGVVSIHTAKIEKADVHGNVPEELFDRFFRQRPKGEEEPQEFRTDSGGSGFFISADGWLITNYHVIEGATAVTLRLNNREYDAEIKGSDPSTDLALLKVAGENFDYLALGDSESLRVGDWVMAVGSPLAFDSSVSVGVVSGKGRSLGLSQATNSFENFIQTDAAINRGNSGGPLVNLAGEVIGISTAMSYGAENIGFAVPVDTLRSVLPQLRESGRVRRGFLGVNVNNIDYKTMRGFGLDSTDGALVTAVTDDTPAAKAGLEPGDVILNVDQHRVKATRDLIDYVSAQSPGKTVELDVIREGKHLSKKVVLEERPAEQETAEEQPKESKEKELEWLGIQYGDLSSEARERLQLPGNLGGVAVLNVAPSSPLYDEGVRPGDVISQVNGARIDSARTFERIVGAARSGDFLRLYVHSVGRQGLFSRFAIVEVP